MHGRCKKSLQGLHATVVLAINVWACAFTFIALGECVLPSVGNGCEWRNTLEWTFQTNGVPILCYRIYWEKDMQSNSDEWSRAVYTKVRRPSVLYHVITCDTNSVGRVNAIEFSSSTNVVVSQNGLMVPLDKAAALPNNPGRWEGVLWQYVERATAPNGMRIFDYYEEGRHLWTVAATTNDVLYPFTTFRRKVGNDTNGSLDLRQIDFFQHLPMVNVNEVTEAFIREESQHIRLGRPDIPEDKALDRARQKLVTLKRINGYFGKAVEKFRKLVGPSFVEWKDYGGPTGTRCGIQFSADGRILFVTSLHNWAGWDGLPVIDLYEYIIDVESFKGVTDITLPCGHSVPVRWNEKSVSCKVEHLSGTADRRRMLVRLCSRYTALYEADKLKVVLCERNVSPKEIALVKILRVLGELPSTCIAHEYQ